MQICIRTIAKVLIRTSLLIVFASLIFEFEGNKIIWVLWVGLVLPKVDEVSTILCFVILNLADQVFKVELSIYVVVLLSAH